jgi:5-amino-6-(5-phosphoribosylamino)uracil reductase
LGIRNSEFAAFVRRKEQAALAAALTPYLAAIDDHDAESMAIGSAWSRSIFGGNFYVSPPPDQSRPACSLVFVQSKDGNTGSRNPTALGGGETDKHLIYEGLSRVAADAVMSGAETIRGGGLMFSVWHPELASLRASLGKPRHPTQIVATLTGFDLDRGMLFNVPEIPVVVVTVGPVAALLQNGLAARPWITPVVMERASDLRLAFEQLRSLGIERVSCIGGRRIARQLIDAGLVQDLYLTTSPRTGGEPNTPLYPRPLDGRVLVRKLGTGADAGVIFEHISLTGRRS